MDQVFRHRDDWFEVGIVPKIRRRTIIGVLLIVLCVVAWLYWGSWAPLILAAVIVAERLFEIAHIPKTKSIISSLIIRATDNGLVFEGAGINGAVFYPWSSLVYSVENDTGGNPVAVSIEDRLRKNSKQKLFGYEGMSELIALIKSNAARP